MNHILERSTEPALTQAVLMINSLGGQPLPLGADRDTLRVMLENQASTDVQHWLLNSTEQRFMRPVR